MTDPTNEAPDGLESARRSPDGRHYWDGTSWKRTEPRRSRFSRFVSRSGFLAILVAMLAIQALTLVEVHTQTGQNARSDAIYRCQANGAANAAGNSQALAILYQGCFAANP